MANDEDDFSTSLNYDIWRQLLSQSIGRRLHDMNFVVSVDANNSVAADSDAVMRETAARELVENYLVKESPNVSWDDIVGCDDAKKALIDAIEMPALHPALMEAYGKTPSKGVLMAGPPGCGKTYLCKAAATAMRKLHSSDERNMLLISGPSILDKYHGETEKVIRHIFAYAKAFKNRYGYRLVIVIDEADALLPSRSTVRETWIVSQVSTFLAEMQGVTDGEAFVVLATNRPEAIDFAIKREGRIDHLVAVTRPTRADADKLLLSEMNRYHSKFVVALRKIRGDTLGDNTIEKPERLAKSIADQVYSPSCGIGRAFMLNRLETIPLHPFISGAMLVGIVERAKMHAINRDAKSGATPIGITLQDTTAAVEEAKREASGQVDFGEVAAWVQNTYGLNNTDHGTAAAPKPPDFKLN